jgi:transposase-like protein
VLVELGLLEQRHKAVLEVLNGATVTDVARRYGVARETLHDWLRRYARNGMAALSDRSSKPATCPHQMLPEVEARVCDLRCERRAGNSRPSSPLRLGERPPRPESLAGLPGVGAPPPDPSKYRRHVVLVENRSPTRRPISARWTQCGSSREQRLPGGEAVFSSVDDEAAPVLAQA